MLRSNQLLVSSAVRVVRGAARVRSMSTQPAMFCYQCEQTQDHKGCSTVGVCGKEPETAALQDLQLYFNVGLGQWADAVVSRGGTVSESVKELLLDSTFATLTNVNFDNSRFYGYLKKANTARDELCAQAKSLGVDGKMLSGPAHFKYSVCRLSF
jgi:hydroxylamine reductase